MTSSLVINAERPVKAKDRWQQPRAAKKCPCDVLKDPQDQINGAVSECNRQKRDALANVAGQKMRRAKP